MHKFIQTLFALAITVSTPCVAQVQAEGSGFRLEIPGSYFKSKYVSKIEPRYTARENGNQLPFGIGPKRVRFILSQIPPTFARDRKAWNEFEAWVEVVPLQDQSVPSFDAAYPSLAECAKGIKLILSSGKIPSLPCENLPVWDFLDAMQMVHAHASILRSTWCSGIEYVTQEVQEATAIAEGRLVYRFVGLSADGQFLVDFCSMVSLPILPIKAPGLEDAQIEAVKKYCRKAEAILNSQSGDSYFPPLSILQGMVKSIGPKKK